MKSLPYPVTDDHIHIDPRNGRGIDAARDFARAGGTHLFLVSKPSWSLGVHPSAGKDYAQVFDETLRVAAMVREIGIVVFPVLGIHPAEISMLAGRMPLAEAAALMKAGLDCAAAYIRDGKAVALKSGRPHYAVDREIAEESNEILIHALTLAADCSCALQIHAESGPCADIAAMAERTGVPVDRVVKHYATPDTPLHPSFIARHDALPQLIREHRPLTMESDFMDENARPGAVIGPKSVPRVTNQLVAAGLMTVEDCYFVHAQTVMKVYGVTIQLP